MFSSPARGRDITIDSRLPVVFPVIAIQQDVSGHDNVVYGNYNEQLVI
ncbi:MAG: hypothetical protein ACK5WS_02370 [Alphaproteobacteria bacterium]|nr:hypothetical protein [Candidatus Jidaibacter sp.]